jgi:hypothetical protein
MLDTANAEVGALINHLNVQHLILFVLHLCFYSSYFLSFSLYGFREYFISDTCTVMLANVASTKRRIERYRPAKAGNTWAFRLKYLFKNIKPLIAPCSEFHFIQETAETESCIPRNKAEFNVNIDNWKLNITSLSFFNKE